MTTLIVGGYGSVGRTITRELASAGSTRGLCVAGRRETKARKFASNFGDEVSGIAFDVRDTRSYDRVLDDVERTIVCVDQSETTFVEACLERGIDYFDITATDRFFRAIEDLEATAVANDATAILNVGLEPGVSNLLAVDAVTALSEVESIEIYSMLGLRNEVGTAGIRWLLEWTTGSFHVREDGATHRVRSISDPKTAEFPEFGRLRTYRFNFADQHSLAR